MTPRNVPCGGSLIVDAAVATLPAGTAEAQRRVVAAFSGDMKGLMQILGHAGPNATYFFIFCLARLNQTNMAGIPHLRKLPEAWAQKDTRAAEIIDPPARAGTDEMLKLAQQYAEILAKNENASSAECQSCAQDPMVWSDNLLLQFSGTPLHILLGLGTNHLKMVSDEATKLDEQIAMCVSDFDTLEAYYEAENQRTEARAEEEHQLAEVESKGAGMAICLWHDPKADRQGSASEAKDEHAWVIKYRALKKDKVAAEKAAAKAAATAVAAEKKLVAARELLSAKVPGGPFTTRYETFLKSLGISMAKYFGGTFVGPDLNKILGSSERISELCAVLKAGQFMCPDGKEHSFGSDTRAAEVEAVLQPLGAAHRLFNRKEALCEHELAEFPKLIKEYAIKFAEVYPKVQPTPKKQDACALLPS